jgi:hypothetical protein
MHLRYGGSTAARQLICSDWTREASKAPQIDRGSDAAHRGTACHWACERYLIDGVEPDDLVGTVHAETGWTFTTSDVDAITQAIAMTEKMFEDFDIDTYDVEPFVRHPSSQEIGGSIDVLAAGAKAVVVLDFKFGYIPVEPDAPQLKFYAMCGRQDPTTSDLFEGRQVYTAVVQPAVSDYAQISEISDLDLFEKEYLLSVALSENGEGLLIAGDHCKYCPAAPYCDAQREQVHKFLHLDPKQAADLGVGMTMVKAMKQQIKEIETETFNALRSGNQVPGWKLVQKIARRFWSDEPGMMKKLANARKLKKEEYLDIKLRSPAQVEKLVKKAGADIDVALYCSNASSEVTLAPESDKRPALPSEVDTAAILANAS